MAAVAKAWVGLKVRLPGRRALLLTEERAALLFCYLQGRRHRAAKMSGSR